MLHRSNRPRIWSQANNTTQRTVSTEQQCFKNVSAEQAAPNIVWPELEDLKQCVCQNTFQRTYVLSTQRLRENVSSKQQPSAHVCGRANDTKHVVIRAESIGTRSHQTKQLATTHSQQDNWKKMFLIELPTLKTAFIRAQSLEMQGASEKARLESRTTKRGMR